MSLWSWHRVIVLLKLELGCCGLQRWIVLHLYPTDHSRLFLGCKIATKSAVLTTSCGSDGLTTSLYILKARGAHGASLLPCKGGLSHWTVIGLSSTIFCAKGLCQVARCAYLALVSFIVFTWNNRRILQWQFFFNYHDIIAFMCGLSALVVAKLRYGSDWPIFGHSCSHGSSNILAFLCRDVPKI